MRYRNRSQPGNVRTSSGQRASGCPAVWSFLPSEDLGEIENTLPLRRQGVSPVGEFLQDFLSRAAFPVHRMGTKTVFFENVIGGDDELKIPSRVGGLQFLMVAAS